MRIVSVVRFDFGKMSMPSGGEVTINVDASGSMFRDRGDLQELAQLISDAQMDRVRQVTQLGLRGQ